MRRITVLGLTFVLVAMLTGAGYDGDRRFKATLTGDQEVPAVETDTRGRAEFKVSHDRSEVDFELRIRKAVDIFAGAGAHIHCGFPGENGPVMVFLAGGIPTGGLDGDVRVEGEFHDEDIIATDCGTTVEDLVQAMRDGRAYVNAHSLANPAGEVRGEIVSRSGKKHR
jgi:hypothetical protein